MKDTVLEVRVVPRYTFARIWSERSAKMRTIVVSSTKTRCWRLKQLPYFRTMAWKSKMETWIQCLEFFWSARTNQVVLKITGSAPFQQQHIRCPQEQLPAKWVISAFPFLLKLLMWPVTSHPNGKCSNVCAKSTTAQLPFQWLPNERICSRKNLKTSKLGFVKRQAAFWSEKTKGGWSYKWTLSLQKHVFASVTTMLTMGHARKTTAHTYTSVGITSQTPVAMEQHARGITSFTTRETTPCCRGSTLIS